MHQPQCQKPGENGNDKQEKPYLLITYYRADIAFANQNRIGRKRQGTSKHENDADPVQRQTGIEFGK